MAVQQITSGKIIIKKDGVIVPPTITEEPTVAPTNIYDEPYFTTAPSGNIDVSELIRCGQDTRRMNDQFKEEQESTMIDRFHIIDKDFQNPNNIVMDLPRGGIQTRKNKKLVDMHDKKKINFNY